jgi:hypothetical protein
MVGGTPSVILMQLECKYASKHLRVKEMSFLKEITFLD